MCSRRSGTRETSHEWLFSLARACTQRRDDGKSPGLREEGGGNGGGYNRGLMKPVEVRQTGSASSPFATLSLFSPPLLVRSLGRLFARVEGIPVSRQNRDIDLSLFVRYTSSLTLCSPPLAPVSLSDCISQTQIAASDSCTRLPAYVTLPGSLCLCVYVCAGAFTQPRENLSAWNPLNREYTHDDWVENYGSKGSSYPPLFDSPVAI